METMEPSMAPSMAPSEATMAPSAAESSDGCDDSELWRVWLLIGWLLCVSVYASILLGRFSQQWYHAIYDPTAVALRDAAKANGRSMPFNWARGVAAMQLLFVPIEQIGSSVQLWFHYKDKESVEQPLYFFTGFLSVSVWLSVYYQMISRLMISFSNSSYRVSKTRIKQYHMAASVALCLFGIWGVINATKARGELENVLLGLLFVGILIGIILICSLTYEFNVRLVNLVVMQCKLQKRSKKQMGGQDHSSVRHSTAGKAVLSQANPPMPSRLETKTSTAMTATRDRMNSGSQMGSPVSVMGPADVIPPVATPVGYDTALVSADDNDEELLETIDDDDDDDDLIDKEAMAEVERKKRLKEKNLTATAVAIEEEEERAELSRALTQEAKESSPKKEEAKTAGPDGGDLGSNLVSVGSVSTDAKDAQKEEPMEVLTDEPKSKRHHKKKSSLFRGLMLNSPRAKSMSSGSSAWRGGDMNEFESHQQSFLKVVTKYTVIATWVFVSVFFFAVGATLFTRSSCFEAGTLIGYFLYTSGEMILLMTTFLAFTKSDGDYARFCGKFDALYGSMAAAIARSMIERESPAKS